MNRRLITYNYLKTIANGSIHFHAFSYQYPGSGILKIYDITGKCIYMERPANDSMTLPSLSVGIYIISYENISRKVMID